ncbi:MAG TPA: hypothetical protein VI837_05780 [Blastocatellia bacterium]|nr:hypothetical protein [Blastocatellia bacterium]
MKRIGFKASLLALLVLGLSSSAMATIDTIKGTLTCFLGCNGNVVQLIAQGENHSFEVVGSFVDTSTAVQITGSGVSVSYGTRKHGANSSIIVNFNVNDNAALGERTVRMRYAIETSGPDTFKVRVVGKGNISRIQYRRPLPFQLGGGRATELVPPTGLPLNQRLVLIVTGTRLSNVEVRPETTYQNVRVLPGATESSCAVEIEFTASGQGPLSFFDSTLSGLDMRSSGSSKFSYTGGTNRNVQYGGAQAGGTTITPPILSGGGGGGSLFVDVAPRANMLFIFRRTSTNPVFTRNGVQYFSIDSEHCNGVLAGQSRIIKVPNPKWGVSNVGTAGTATPFPAELRSGAQALSTQTITTLNPGQTREFTFPRQNSSVRVFTFLDRGGCFVSLTADRFFEDPPFTVVVNTNNALTEAAAAPNNNSRNY